MKQDMRFELHGILFVWNESKARTNLDKHGVAFERAVEAFFDPFLRIVDASGSNQEMRDALIGMDESWNLVFIVHIAFEAESIRIISARKATKKERMDYES